VYLVDRQSMRHSDGAASSVTHAVYQTKFCNPYLYIQLMVIMPNIYQHRSQCGRMSVMGRVSRNIHRKAKRCNSVPRGVEDKNSTLRWRVIRDGRIEFIRNDIVSWYSSVLSRLKCRRPSWGGMSDDLGFAMTSIRTFKTTKKLEL
jgi:hypothetical protein